MCCQRFVAVALLFQITLFAMEVVAMCVDAIPESDALFIGYNGPQDKTVPPLLLSQSVIDDPGTLFRSLGLSQAEEEFGAVAVVMEQATFQHLVEITASTTMDATTESAILFVTVIDTGKPSANTVTLSKKTASDFLGQVLVTVEDIKSFDIINAWVARTNLVRL